MNIKWDEKTGDSGGGETAIMARWLIKNINSVDVFIDIGAHVGFSGIPVVIEKNPHFSIFVEPDEYTCKILIKNIDRNNIDRHRCVVVEKMVMDKVGKGKYYKFPLSCHNSIVNRDWSKVEIEKETTTIDALVEEYKIDRPIVLKIDAESAEPYIWKGLKKSIPLIKVICMEFAAWHYENDVPYIPDIMKPEDFIKEIKKDGFEVFDYNDKPLDGKDLYASDSNRINICLKKV